MTTKSTHRGFTLVELLIVIAIIVVLAALAFAVVNKAVIKARAAKMTTDMKQITPLMNLYAIDHQSKLPACKGTVDYVRDDGTIDPLEMQWNEVLLSILYPKDDPAEFKTQAWVDANKNFLNNPFFKPSDSPRGATPLNPGFGYNIMMPINYKTIEDGTVLSDTQAMAYSVPTTGLSEPGRTPLIAPYDNYYYRFDESQINEFKSATLMKFLTDGKFPVLFADGHVELVRPEEYISRKLHMMPMNN